MTPCWRTCTGRSLMEPFGLLIRYSWARADGRSLHFSGAQRYGFPGDFTKKTAFFDAAFLKYGWTGALGWRSGAFVLLFLRFGRPDGQHTLAFHFRHAFQHPRVVQPFGEFQQEQLPSFLELDGAAFELYIGLDLIAVLQEFLGVLRFEVEIMIVRIQREADLFYFGGLALGLHFLFLFLLLVKEFIVIDDLTYWRVCIGRDLDEVKPLFLRHLQRFLDRINAYFYIFSYQPDLGNPDHVIGTMFLLLFFSETWIEIASRLPWWKCHLRFLSSPSPYEDVNLFLDCFQLPPSGLGGAAAVLSLISSCSSLMNSPIFFAPRSPLPCRRTDAVPSFISFSPI